MKWLKYSGMMLLVVLVGIQFIPTSLNQNTTVPSTDFIKANGIPGNVSHILKTSCYNCHSNNTDYPWYSSVQPAGWLLEKHIKEGKEALNFSEFGASSTRRQRSKLRAMIGQIENDEMPLPSYTLLHSEARLSQEEKNDVIKYLNILQERLNNK